MGNILCRDKTPRRVYVKGPVKGADKVFDPQLFSNDSLVNGTKKDTGNQNSNNNRMFFSTPNLNNDMKSTISLDARIFDSGNTNNPPIAPPRKKRTTLKKGSTLPSTLPSDVVRNGFKDVFGNSSISSRNMDDIDYIDKDENSLDERSMTHQRSSTPEKKLRVGNKKSDKLLGESLSDHLSDNPISPIPKTTKTNNNADVLDDTQDDESKTISDKKLSFFLMNMLDDIRNAEDEEKYKNKIPVYEPPFVAKKREIKHICDDDDHIHVHIYGDEKENNDHAPPKPDRDFSKFKSIIPETSTPNINDEIIDLPNKNNNNNNNNNNDNDNNTEKVEVVQAKVLVKRGISRENLPSPPATPHRKKGVTSPPSTPTITIETIDAAIDNILKSDEHEELQKALPNESNITELVDQVIKKAYGMSDFNYHPEDIAHHTQDDGSNLVTPTSKLAVRKISTPRKVSTESVPSIDSESMCVKTTDLTLPSTPYKKSSFCENEVKLNQMLDESHAKFYEIDEAARIPLPVDRNSKNSEEITGSSMNDIINEIYTKNSDIMKEFQSFLEQSVEKEPVINVDDERKFLEAKKTLEDNAEDPVKNNYEEDEFENPSYSDSFESTDDEREIVKVDNNKDETLIQPTILTKRRESIEDVENWFSQHIETDQKESEVCSSRSGSEHRSSLGYDRNKIFPFGSTITGRRDSQSDEFFTDTVNIIQRIKHSIEPVQETSIFEESEVKKETKDKAFSKESSPDHSTLLKYLDKNNTVEGSSSNN